MIRRGEGVGVPRIDYGLMCWCNGERTVNPKEENETLAGTAQVTHIKRHEHSGGLDFA
jgi:hypothetical protein